MECLLCLCNINKEDSHIKCKGECEPCNFHSECFKNYIESANTRNNIDHWKKFKKLRCPLFDRCNNDFEEDDILDNNDVRKDYINLTRNIEGTISAESTKAQIELTKQKVEINMSKNNLADISKSILFEIKNDLLTNILYCPECKLPFIDFSGCLALECAGCNQHFCGLCFKSCENGQDSHRCVASHTQNYSNEFKLKYEFNEVFFISAIGWKKWVEKLKKEAILKYLLEFKIEVIWANIYDILNVLKTEELITSISCIEIENIIYYHNENNQIHNLRIPIEFAKICSGKFNIKFEEVISKYALPTEHKMEIGNIIIKEIKIMYPNWKFNKFQVPGETYSANNYPPQLLPLISKIIEDYCNKNKIWELLKIKKIPNNVRSKQW